MRLPIFLAALALAAAPAAGAFAAPAADAPAARAPQPGEADYTPDGAPRDDYNFTAWCRGVLEGHMALAEHVQTVLPLDEVQQKIGKAYLKGYDEALRIGKKGRSEAELDAADAVRFAARANWNTAMQSPLQLGADTYLAWQLPGRCEHAAKRVAKRDDIFELAPSQADVEALGSHMRAGDDSPSPARAGPLGDEAAAPVAAPVAVAEVAAPVPEAPAPEVPELGPLADVALAPAETDAMVETAAPAGEGDTEAAAAPAETEMVSVDALTGGTMATAEATPPPEEEAAPPVVAAAAAPAPTPPAAQPAQAEPRRDANGRLISMPRKGRLFPWGKRE